MKFLVGLVIVLAIIYFAPPFLQMQNSRQIQGNTVSQVKKSALKVRKSMSTSDRNVFDMAFGIVEKIKSEESPEAFVKAVNGLEVDQLIELAKHEVNIKIGTGYPDLKAYSSWDDMVAKAIASGEPHKKGAGDQSPIPLRQSERTARPAN
jgi:hypothetical protein